MLRAAGLISLGMLILGAGGAAPTFESHWQDGKAELDGYRYTVTRYGEPRQGTAVMIYVTEPFSDRKRVKVDHPGASPNDTFEALKLNFVRDFQTGIYDYNTMTSLFVRSRDFSPVKISFSSAEWCGQVYEEMIFQGARITDRYASYFEDESGSRELDLREKGLAEEELFIRLRDLRGGWLQPGERRTVPFLASSFHRRLAHAPLSWTEAILERGRTTETVVVPAGRFKTSVTTVTLAGIRQGRFWIEEAYPHRVVRWEWKPAAKGAAGGARRSAAEALDAGDLTGSTRVAYWRLQGVGGEAHLKQLGLTAGSGGARTGPSK